MTAVRGKVTDAKTGEAVYNAHVYFTDANGNKLSPTVGTVTDFNGNFQFPTLGGVYLTVSHVAYKNQTKAIDLSLFQAGGTYGQVINYSLQSSGYMLPEVVIRPEQLENWWTKNRPYVLSAAAILAIGYVVLKNN